MPGYIEPAPRRPLMERSILLIDNYDSFTHNLEHALAMLGPRIEIAANDRISVSEIVARNPDYVVISPGPKGPLDAGVSMSVIRDLAGSLPILGVCLGHQCIGQVYGSSVRHASRPVHGKTSEIFHCGTSIFTGMPKSFRVARYHSLIVPHPPPGFEVLAWTNEHEIMAIGHVRFRLWGVQFHPESFLTEHGDRLLLNFLENGNAGAALRVV